MSDIFISYAREDRPRARMLADALEAKGWSVWWDPRIRSGEAFDRIIETALADARCVVVLWSQRSVGSDWVRAEASNGLSRGILISVLIDNGVTLPLRFSQVQTEQLSDWDGTNTSPVLQKLLTDIAFILGPPGSTTQEAVQGSQSETVPKSTEADMVGPHRTQNQDKPSRGNAPLVQEPWWKSKKLLQGLTALQLANVLLALVPVPAFAPGGVPADTDMEELGYVLVWISLGLMFLTGVWFSMLKWEGRLRMSFARGWVLPAAGLGIESLAMIFEYELGHNPLLGAPIWLLAVGCLLIGAYTALQAFRQLKTP